MQQHLFCGILKVSSSLGCDQLFKVPLDLYQVLDDPSSNRIKEREGHPVSIQDKSYQRPHCGNAPVYYSYCYRKARFTR